MNGLTLILMNELLYFGNNVRHCGTERSPYVSVVVNGCQNSLDNQTPMYSSSPHTCVIPLANVSVTLFLRVAQNLKHIF